MQYTLQQSCGFGEAWASSLALSGSQNIFEIVEQDGGLIGGWSAVVGQAAPALGPYPAWFCIVSAGNRPQEQLGSHAHMTHKGTLGDIRPPVAVKAL